MTTLTAISALDNVCAQIKGEPIRLAEQMPRNVETKNLSPDHHEAITTKFWATHYTGTLKTVFPGKSLSHGKAILELRDRLLTFGGEQGCMPDMEEDIFPITERGQFWYGDEAQMEIGRPSQCHKNSAELYDNNTDNPKVKLKIATGYALSTDGLWRQHTWLVHVLPHKNSIIETTSERVAYFGFVMTNEEAERFVYDNY